MMKNNFLKFLLAFALFVPFMNAPAQAAGNLITCSYDAANAYRLGVPVCDTNGNLKTTISSGAVTVSSGTISISSGTVTSTGLWQISGSNSGAANQDTNNNLYTVNAAQSGTSSALTALNTSVIIPLVGYQSTGFTVSGTWVGNLNFLGSVDGGVTYPITMSCYNNTGGFDANNTTSNGTFTCGTMGLSNVKITFASYTSGTATVTYHVGMGLGLVAGDGTPIQSMFLLGDGNGGANTGLAVGAQCFAFNGSTEDRCRKDTYAAGPNWTTNGGSLDTPIATNTTTTIKTGAGRLAKILVTSTGTGTGNCYNNTSAGGTIIAAIPASAAVGTVYDLQMPYTTGLTCISATSGPGFTVSYW